MNSFDAEGYGSSFPNHQQIVTGWEPSNIQKAFSKHVDNFLFNGVKSISSSSETYELSLEQGKIHFMFMLVIIIRYFK